MENEMGKKLKARLQESEVLIAPGAYDPLCAKIIEKAGFEAVYMTGYGTSASVLGAPDVGLLTMTEMLERAQNISAAVNIPVIADADTGYGNAVNVMRVVRLYEKAGIAAIQLEDQVAPKKCGHMLGREIISQDEMVGKINAAADARQSENTLIMARTDARTNFGLEEALKRGHAYEKAGADILFIESVESEDEMRQVTSSFGVPVIANMIEHGRTPVKSKSELQDIGYDLAIYPCSSTFVVAKAMTDLMNHLKNQETTLDYENNMLTFDEFTNLAGLPEIRADEEKYKTGRKKEYTN
ncbi:isocitrate lyase/PEP mutase family protein [Paucilactobacillus sp. N302-9]